MACGASSQQAPGWGSPLGVGHEDWRSPQHEATLMNADYARTVQLLLAVAPAIFSSPVFAMEGGTAIKLFVIEAARFSAGSPLPAGAEPRPR